MTGNRPMDDDDPTAPRIVRTARGWEAINLRFQASVSPRKRGKKPQLDGASMRAVGDARMRNREEAMLRSVNIPDDTRTMVGVRNITIVDVGGVKQARLSASFDDILKTFSERTPERKAAWDRFADVAGHAFAGMLQTASFDVAVDGRSSYGMQERQLRALQEIAAMKSVTGIAAYAVLMLVIYEGRNFAELESQGLGERRSLSELLRAGLDSIASMHGGSKRRHALFAAVDRYGV